MVGQLPTRVPDRRLFLATRVIQSQNRVSCRLASQRKESPYLHRADRSPRPPTDPPRWHHRPARAPAPPVPRPVQLAGPFSRIYALLAGQRHGQRLVFPRNRTNAKCPMISISFWRGSSTRPATSARAQHPLVVRAAQVTLHQKNIPTSSSLYSFQSSLVNFPNYGEPGPHSVVQLCKSKGTSGRSQHATDLSEFHRQRDTVSSALPEKMVVRTRMSLCTRRR